jgi:hypothetical protein
MFRWMACALGGLMVCGAALAEDVALRFKEYKVRYELRDDASYQVHYSWDLQVLNQRGVEQARQYGIHHSASVETSKINEAYTLKPDGRRIEVPSGNYQMSANTGVKGKPAFSDYVSITVIFPELNVGDTVHLAYTVDLKEAIFPGMFSISQAYSRWSEYDKAQITIDAPIGMWAQYEAREMAQTVREVNGRRVVEWTMSNPKAIATERQVWSVYDPDKEPGFSYSTFRSYAEIAEAYGVRARPKAVPSVRVREIAQEAVKGKESTRDKVRALYDWVATNIAYAGNCIGVGAVVPRDQEFVIDNKMGDCKDHATLLQALLSAQGIESTQVLVNAGSQFKLRKIPVSSDVNHVFTYVPALDLYMDSTSSSTPFGMLPSGVQAKPVLHVDNFKIAKAPALQPGTNAQHVKTWIEVAADGSAKGTVEVSLKGEPAAETRSRFRDWPEDNRKKYVKSSLRDDRLNGEGSIGFEDPKALEAQFKYTISFTVQNLLPLGGGTVPLGPLFWTPAPVMRYLNDLPDMEPEYETFCTNGASVEEYVYVLPKTIKVSTLPKDVLIKEPLLHYSTSYKLNGNRLTISRTLDDRTPGGVCSAATNNAYSRAAARALKTTRAQVIYR